MQQLRGRVSLLFRLRIGNVASPPLPPPLFQEGKAPSSRRFQESAV